jgi:hypothetical protein
MEKGFRYPWAECKRYYHKIFIERKLGKGARDRYTISYRQYIDMVYGSNGRQGQDRQLDTPVRSLKAVT